MRQLRMNVPKSPLGLMDGFISVSLFLLCISRAMKKIEWFHLSLYILRCSGSATLSYLLAGMIGLPFPVWAAVSSVIVSQTRLHDTQTSVSGRIVGTITGVAVALLVELAASGMEASMALQIAVAVAVCALIAHLRPVLRVCMWTSPIVLLTANPAVSIFAAGIYRGCEVILGCLVGGGLHFATEKLVAHLPWAQQAAKEAQRPSPLADD